jgi:hypothetical protein
MENWKAVEGYEGLYEVSDQGRVRSLDRYTTGKRNRLIKGKVLANAHNELGYCIVQLCKDGVPKKTRVHRLVARAFIPNPEEKPYVNHLDGNPSNNTAQNLEWCTQKENIQHAYATGLYPPMGKLTREQVEYIKKKYVPYRYSAQKLADEIGVDIMTIYGAIHDKQRYIRDGRMR